MRIDLDRGLCLGYGNCVMEAPEIFDLDEQTNQAVIDEHAAATGDPERAYAAARACPAGALRVAE